MSRKRIRRYRRARSSHCRRSNRTGRVDVRPPLATRSKASTRGAGQQEPPSAITEDDAHTTLTGDHEIARVHDAPSPIAHLTGALLAGT